jgi:hypothetical protein
LDTFGSLWKLKPRYRKLSSKKKKDSIIIYCIYKLTINKIRELYNKGIEIDELSRKFSMISEDYLNKITEPKKKGWAYKASDLAFDYASERIGIKRSYLRKILREEKFIFAEIKRRAESWKEEPERLLKSNIEFLSPWWSSLEKEKIKTKEWQLLMKRSLSYLAYFGPFRNIGELKSKLPFLSLLSADFSSSL